MCDETPTTTALLKENCMLDSAKLRSQFNYKLADMLSYRV